MEATFGLAGLTVGSYYLAINEDHLIDDPDTRKDLDSALWLLGSAAATVFVYGWSIFDAYEEAKDKNIMYRKRHSSGNLSLKVLPFISKDYLANSETSKGFTLSLRF